MRTNLRARTAIAPPGSQKNQSDSQFPNHLMLTDSFRFAIGSVLHRFVRLPTPSGDRSFGGTPHTAWLTNAQIVRDDFLFGCACGTARMSHPTNTKDPTDKCV